MGERRRSGFGLDELDLDPRFVTEQGDPLTGRMADPHAHQRHPDIADQRVDAGVEIVHLDGHVIEPHRLTPSSLNLPGFNKPRGSTSALNRFITSGSRSRPFLSR